jgi:hypothetical protein
MTSRALAGVCGLVLAFAGCADFERGPAAPAPDASVGQDGDSDGDSDAAVTDGAAVSFAATVRPLLEPCVRCHAAGQQAGDTSLLFTGIAAADYAAVVSFTDTATPTASRLLAKMRGQGHEGGAIYAADAPEYMTILHWIQQGARP